MNKLMVCCLLSAMFFVSGCVVRTYTTEIDRVDQEMSGNRGVIVGTPPEVSETAQVKKTRKIYNVDVEVPSTYMAPAEERVRSADKDLYGNRGYVKGRMSPEKEVYVSEKREQVSAERLGASSAKMPQIVYSEPSGNAGTENLSSGSGNHKQFYIVQKGDTLQKISEKLFGTTQKWTSLYNANKHILKSPDRIRPGQKLLIP